MLLRSLVGAVGAVSFTFLQAASALDAWAPVTQAIEDFNIANMAVVVTNASGIQYLYEKGNTSYTKTVMSKSACSSSR